MVRGGYVYILTNKNRTTIYVGVTAELSARLWKHKNQFYGSDSFSARYNLILLVYYEAFDNIVDAIAREKQFKKLVKSEKR